MSRSTRILADALPFLICACGGGEADAPRSAAAGWPVAVERTGKGQPEYERVVLVTIDTLRADHLSCYGYPRPTTPFLDSLAARGARFTHVMASVSQTAPSHATILTGLAPAVHGVLENGWRLDPNALDLAKLFGERGYETAAFLNVNFLGGVAASFGKVEVRGSDARNALTGAEVVDTALRWLAEERKSERFFLWVHLYDPHRWKGFVIERAGRPGPIWTGKTPPGFLDTLASLHGLRASQKGQPFELDWHIRKEIADVDFDSVEGFRRCIDAYDWLTRFADQQVERLYKGLEGLGLPGRTLWVVTADHGEGLASHGAAGHGGRIYQEQLHVPLLLHATDGSIAPRVVDELVAHVDLFPTLAATLGVRAVADAGLYDGRDLWPLVRGQDPAWKARLLFAQRRPTDDPEDPDTAEVFALQSAGAKYILHEPGADEFFDLAADPRELVNLGEQAPAAAGLRAEIEQRLLRFRSLAPAAAQEQPAEWQDELRRLGYAR